MKSSKTIFQLVAMLSIFHLSPAVTAEPRQGDAKAVAIEHFDKGVAAFNEKRFGEAAQEFDAAYTLSPAFVVLYNIGQVNVALGRSVEAVAAFDEYLKQGASQIAPVRRQEVEAEIERQSARIGTVLVRTKPEGAEVRIDGRLFGKTPWARPIRLTAGSHTVEGILTGHTTQVREIDVAGRAQVEMVFELDPVIAPQAAAAAPINLPAPSPVTPPAAPLVVVQAPAAAPPPVVERPSFNWQRTAGYVVATGGLITVTAGGLIAFGATNDANDARDRLATQSGDAWDATKSEFDTAKRRSQNAWTIAGVGAAVLLGGVLVIVTAPESGKSVGFAPWMTAQSGGLVFAGAW